MPIGRDICVLAFMVPVALLCAACSSAKVGDAEGEGSSEVDAGNLGGGLPDGGGPATGLDAAAPPPDAGQVRLTQSFSEDVIGLNSVACPEAVNSYYRVFDLAAEGVTGPIEVKQVTFGVEESVSGSGGLDATVVLYTLDGALALANLDLVIAADTVIPDVAEPPGGEAGGLHHVVPIEATIEPGSTLVVEVTHPGLNQDQSLLMGSNRAGQSGSTFLRAPECGDDEPTRSEDIETDDGEQPVMHWVLVVEGLAP